MGDRLRARVKGSLLMSSKGQKKGGVFGAAGGNMGGRGTAPLGGVEDHELDALRKLLEKELTEDLEPRLGKEAKGKRGNELKLSVPIIAQIAFYLRRGNDILPAVAAVGVRRRTFYGWLEDAHDEAKCTKLHALLVHTIERAIGEAEVLDVGKISAAATRGAWGAAAWKLERRFPGRWGAARANGTAAGDRPPNAPGPEDKPTTAGLLGGLRIYVPVKDEQPLDEELPAAGAAVEEDDDHGDDG
jgi:hypothetical protein